MFRWLCAFLRREFVRDVPAELSLCLDCGKLACSEVEFSDCGPRKKRAAELAACDAGEQRAARTTSRSVAGELADGRDANQCPAEAVAHGRRGGFR